MADATPIQLAQAVMDHQFAPALKDTQELDISVRTLMNVL
jgi:hypothetical protein